MCFAIVPRLRAVPECMDVYRRWWHFVIDYMACKLSNSNGLVGALSFLDCLGCNYKRTLLRNKDEIPRNSKRKSKNETF